MCCLTSERFHFKQRTEQNEDDGIERKVIGYLLLQQRAGICYFLYDEKTINYFPFQVDSNFTEHGSLVNKQCTYRRV